MPNPSVTFYWVPTMCQAPCWTLGSIGPRMQEISYNTV